MGRYQDAEPAYRRSLALAPTFNAYQALGMTYYRMRRFEEAITMFEQARRFSDNYRGPGSLGRVYYGRGRKAEARALFDVAIEGLDRAIQVNPNDVGAHLLLAEFHAKLGHQIEAERVLVRRVMCQATHTSRCSSPSFTTISVIGRRRSTGWRKQRRKDFRKQNFVPGSSWTICETTHASRPFLAAGSRDPSLLVFGRRPT